MTRTITAALITITLTAGCGAATSTPTATTVDTDALALATSIRDAKAALKLAAEPKMQIPTTTVAEIGRLVRNLRAHRTTANAFALGDAVGHAGYNLGPGRCSTAMQNLGTATIDGGYRAYRHGLDAEIAACS